MIAVELQATYFCPVLKPIFVSYLSFGLFCFSVPAAAQGSDWPGPLIWKAGERITRTTKSKVQHEGSVRVDSKIKEIVLNQVKEYERSRKVTWSYSRRIARVRKGLSSKDRVEIAKWEWLEQDGLPDTSLTNYSFDFVGADRGRSRRLVKKGEDKLSKNAQDWVERNLRTVDEPVLLATWPEDSVVRATDTWEVDPLKLAISLNLDEFSRINVPKSKASAKLLSLRMVNDVTWGKYQVDSVFTLGQMPGTNSPWKEGGTLKLTIQIDGPMENGPYGPYVIEIVGDLSGKGLIKGERGDEFSREIRMSLTGKWSRSTR